MAEFVGKYKYDKDDGKFDEFLKAMDVNYVTRKMACNISPTVEISINDGVWTVKTISTFKNSQIDFKLGEEFEEKRMDGHTVKTVITQEGNVLTQKQESKPPVEIIREFSGDRLITTCKCNGVVCVREYTKEK